MTSVAKLTAAKRPYPGKKAAPKWTGRQIVSNYKSARRDLISCAW